MTRVYFDPLDENCKNVIGAIKCGQSVKLKIFSDGNEGKLLLFDDFRNETVVGGEKKDGAFVFKLSLKKKGLYFYLFSIDGKIVGKNENGFAEVSVREKFQLSVGDKNYSYPVSWYGGIIYQIFPDRFSKAEGYGDKTGKKMRKWGDMPEYLPDENGEIKNDDFFGGNFEGIKNKLPYLRSLGVTAVYLNPIVKARSSHRYDTGDYMSFDPLLGTDDDFKRLVERARDSGIRIIFDGVFNHVGDDSIYFNKYGTYNSVGAYNSKKSPYKSWFTFRDYPNAYTAWWGIKTLPTIKRGASGFEELILGDNGVIDRYFKFKAGGIRLDVVDELSDKFTKKINAKIKSYDRENIVIGEVWEDATNKIAYDERKTYFTSGELDSVMNYPLKDAIIDFVISGNSNLVYRTVREQIDHYPSGALPLLMNILSTHDTPRILTVLGKSGNLAKDRNSMAREVLSEKERTLGIKRLKCASLIQFTVYGLPSVYYGDEIGMEGNKDPFNRKCFEEDKADKEVYSWYSFLTDLRTKHSCFKDGKTVNVKSHGGVFYYSRAGKDESITVIINCGKQNAFVKLSEEAKELSRGQNLSKIKLSQYEFAIFLKEKI